MNLYVIKCNNTTISQTTQTLFGIFIKILFDLKNHYFYFTIFKTQLKTVTLC